MYDRSTECRFDLQAMWVINMLGLFRWHVIQGVYTISHWKTSGPIVQESNVYTVHETFKQITVEEFIQVAAEWNTYPVSQLILQRSPSSLPVHSVLPFFTRYLLHRGLLHE